MHLGRTRTLLASLFFIALTTGTFSVQAQSPLSAYTQQQTEFLPVDEAYELSVIGTTERGALLQWLIAPDYYTPLLQKRARAVKILK
jgi:thiol:disulfide interchange protein